LQPCSYTLNLSWTDSHIRCSSKTPFQWLAPCLSSGFWCDSVSSLPKFYARPECGLVCTYELRRLGTESQQMELVSEALVCFIHLK
jgi:hypothetical protein